MSRGGAHIALSIDFLKATSSIILHSVPNNLKSFRKYSNIFEVSKIVLGVSTMLEVSVSVFETSQSFQGFQRCLQKLGKVSGSHLASPTALNPGRPTRGRGSSSLTTN